MSSCFQIWKDSLVDCHSIRKDAGGVKYAKHSWLPSSDRIFCLHFLLELHYALDLIPESCLRACSIRLHIFKATLSFPWIAYSIFRKDAATLKSSWRLLCLYLCMLFRIFSFFLMLWSEFQQHRKDSLDLCWAAILSARKIRGKNIICCLDHPHRIRYSAQPALQGSTKRKGSAV